MPTTTPKSIKLTKEDGWWVALDEESGIASQGKTREEALNNLDEAVKATKEVQSETSSPPEPDAPWFE